MFEDISLNTFHFRYIKSQKLHARITKDLQELNERLEKRKLENENLTNKIKESFSNKSFLHKRLMDAFPTFEITDKLKEKIKNKKI